MTRAGTASGRPLQVLALFALAVPLWIVVRLPDLESRLDRTLAQLRQPVAVTPRPDIASVMERRGANAPDMLPIGAADVARGLPVLPRQHPRPEIVPPLPVFVPPIPPDAITSTIPATMPPAPPPATAFDLATAAYARLAAGDRRAADRGFAGAIAMASADDPLRHNWVRERQRLNRHWSGDAWTLFRDAGSSAAAASPVLGGGQSGASLAYAFDPLARRPLALLGRLYAAHDSRSRIDGETAQAAIGVRWQAAPGISLAAERLLAIGNATASDWNLRLAAGGERRQGRVALAGYGEAGVRGNGDAYAGGQASAMAEIARARRLVFSAGPGVWGSVQTADAPISRLDIGIGATARLPAGVAIAADWRWRIAGNADPDSGPAVTVSVAF